MKKGLLAISVCIVLLQLCGCTNNGINANEAIEREAAASEAVESAEGTQDKSESIGKDYSSIGYDLVRKESMHILNNAATGAELVSTLGEPEEKSEAAVWEADGLEHQTWYYRKQGLKIDLTKDGSNTQSVNSVRICSPSGLCTMKGIGIGSHKDEILKAYGNEINMEDNGIASDIIVAGTMYGGLVFKLENNQVSSIFIGAAAE